MEYLLFYKLVICSSHPHSLILIKKVILNYNYIYSSKYIVKDTHKISYSRSFLL